MNLRANQIASRKKRENSARNNSGNGREHILLRPGRGRVSERDWQLEGRRLLLLTTQHRFLRFDAQSDGKGTLTVTDPQSKVWAGAKPSEAKWTPGEGNSVTFSGPVEFLIGNVGRDAGTLTLKGKFDTPDLITGEVDFSPLVGDGPSKHGTFKAVRAGGG